MDVIKELTAEQLKADAPVVENSAIGGVSRR